MEFPNSALYSNVSLVLNEELRVTPEGPLDNTPIHTWLGLITCVFSSLIGKLLEILISIILYAKRTF
jgi:hypothetical protein